MIFSNSTVKRPNQTFLGFENDSWPPSLVIPSGVPLSE